MNARSAAARLRAPLMAPVEPPAPAGATLLARRVRSVRRRRLLVLGLQVLVAVVWLGSWQLTTQLGLVDKFFFAQPSEIAQKLWVWITEGTELGPLWDQVLPTMEETFGGFVVGSLLGIVLGVALGRIRLLSDVLSPCTKGAHAIRRVVGGALSAVPWWLGLMC